MKTNLIDLIGPLLRRLNLLEHRGDKLSWTNIAVVVCVVKIAVAPQISLPEIGALLLALMNYAHKRIESTKALKVEQDKLPNAQDIIDQIKSVQVTVAEQAKTIADQQKVIDDAKQALTAQKLAASQTRRQL